MRGFRYFRPTSLTWWSGVFLIAVGAAVAGGWVAPGDPAATGWRGVLAAVLDVLIALTGGGNATPAVLIGNGLGIIGLRDAIARDSLEHFAAEEYAFEIEDDAAFEDGDAWAGGSDPNQGLPAGESKFPPGLTDPYKDGRR